MMQRIYMGAASNAFQIDEKFVVRDGAGRVVETWWCVDRWARSKTRDRYVFNVDGYVDSENL